jgi:hypothetical protein
MIPLVQHGSERSSTLAECAPELAGDYENLPDLVTRRARGPTLVRVDGEVGRVHLPPLRDPATP